MTAANKCEHTSRMAQRWSGEAYEWHCAQCGTRFVPEDVLEGARQTFVDLEDHAEKCCGDVLPEIREAIDRIDAVLGKG